MGEKPPASLPLEMVLEPEREHIHSRHIHYRLRSQFSPLVTPPRFRPIAHSISPPLSVYSSAWDTRMDCLVTPRGIVSSISQPFDFPTPPESVSGSGTLTKTVCLLDEEEEKNSEQSRCSVCSLQESPCCV
jgi:hypothetical protein